MVLKGAVRCCNCNFSITISCILYSIIIMFVSGSYCLVSVYILTQSCKPFQVPVNLPNICYFSEDYEIKNVPDKLMEFNYDQLTYNVGQ